MRKHYKLTKKFYNNIFVLLSTLLLVFCFYIIAQKETEKQLQNNKLLASNDYIVEVVQNGGTLWNICKRYKPQSIDLREYIDIVKQYNNINNNEYLQINQQIKLPQ